MNTLSSRSLFKALRPAGLFLLALLFLTGCWQDRVVWSPDATRAAIITKDGLHLCTAAGQLSPLLVPGAYRAAWLPDSQQLLVAHSRKITDYGALTEALGPGRTRTLIAKTEALWQRIADDPTFDHAGPLEPADDLGALLLCLRARHGAELRAKLKNKDAADLESASAEWHTLAVARLTGDRLEFAAPIAEGLASFRDLRPTPSGQALAFVTPMELSLENDAGLQLFVAPIDRSAPPTLVAAQVAAHPDWTPDSRALLYLQAEGSRASGKPDDLRLGTLVEREVLEATGHIRLAGQSRELAGLIFQIENRVRCLRDGRVLFDAAEIQLPLAGHDRQVREQLYSLDRTVESSALLPLISPDELPRLPNPLTFFEVSPDETAVLIGGASDVPILHLRDRRIEHCAVPLVSGHQDQNPPLPTWRRSGEFTYLRAPSPRAELVLRRGADESVLSLSWPDEVLQQLIK